jgi:hypothetical protein
VQQYRALENQKSQNILRQVIALLMNGRVSQLKPKLSNQSGALNIRLPMPNARFELRITLPICRFHSSSYCDSGVPFCRFDAIAFAAILPPIIATVIPAPFEGKTIPAASPTNT